MDPIFLTESRVLFYVDRDFAKSVFLLILSLFCSVGLYFIALLAVKTGKVFIK